MVKEFLDEEKELWEASRHFLIKSMNNVNTSHANFPYGQPRLRQALQSLMDRIGQMDKQEQCKWEAILVRQIAVIAGAMFVEAAVINFSKKNPGE